jgi:hypothetical protein
MPIRLFHIGFERGFPGFSKSNILSQFFPSVQDKIVDNIDIANVLVIGNFVQQSDMYSILNFKGIRIIYVGEPIGRFVFSEYTDNLFKNDLYHYCIGSISNKPGRWIKYPIYFNQNIDYKAVNTYISTCSLNGKQFCTLISRHDSGNTRIPIMTELSKRFPVSCPGKLANNCSNEELNRIGHTEYIKKFVFHICSENFGECHPGYITEKLINCCLGGAIPIYFGNLDSIDQKIFNKNRILFLNYNNVEEVAKRVFTMCDNMELLEEFYRQPAFMDSAESTMKEIGIGVRNFFSSLNV